MNSLRRGLQTAVNAIGVWVLVAVLAMLMTWTLPRTLVGLVLAFTVVPALCLVLQGLGEAVFCHGPLARFNESIERRTREDRISGLRIFVLLLELLILAGIAVALSVAIARVTGIDMAAADAFLRRHFWP